MRARWRDRFILGAVMLVIAALFNVALVFGCPNESFGGWGRTVRYASAAAGGLVLGNALWRGWNPR